MSTVGKAHILSSILALLLLCSCATDHRAHEGLPPEMALNEDAGRGSWIFITLRVGQNEEELPFLLETGSPVTMFDKSLESKLGSRLGEGKFHNFGVEQRVGAYAPPRLYLGPTQLKTCLSNIVSFDFAHYSAKSHRPIKGALGMDVLQNYCIQLDFAAGTMRFLDDETADKASWGKEFPLHFDANGCPFVEENLVGAKGDGSLIDTGCNLDGWLKPKLFQQWTNRAQLPPRGEARAPVGMLGGETYPGLKLQEDTSGCALNGIGLAVLARNLVTFDFPKRRLYLKRTSLERLLDRTTEATLMSAVQVLLKLKREGRLPGFPIHDERHGTLSADFDSPSTMIARVQPTGEPDIHHYRLIQASKDGPWTLRNAWRTDRNGRLLQEYPVP